MKKIISYIVVFIVVLLLGLFIFLPKIDFSDVENRYLQAFPKFSFDRVIDGTFMDKFNLYISDHFPFRKELLNFKTNVLKTAGVYEQNDVYFGKDGYLLENYPKPKNNEKIVKVVNEFSSNFLDININFMLVPTSIYVNSDKLPKYNNSFNEKNTIDYYKDNLDIDFIDVSNTLLENKNTYLYYHTDHHWTTEGAYLGYVEFSKKNNLDIQKYEFEEITNKFYGTLYSKVLDNNIQPDTILSISNLDNYEVNYVDNDLITNSVYNDKYLNMKDKYSYFLDNNHALITITNNNIIDNSNILIIKDSYANCFIPFLIYHYKQIHIIDPRYYKKSISDYVKNNNIQNILFLYNVLTIDNDLGILSIY